MQDSDIDNIIFGGSPLGKLIDILKFANQNLVEKELESFISGVATVELMLEKLGVDEKQIGLFAFENEESIRERTGSIILTLASDILTQNE